jgi:hypothetical protein
MFLPEGVNCRCIQSEEIPAFHETWRVAVLCQMHFSYRHLSSLTLSHQQAIVTGGFNRRADAVQPQVWTLK